MNHFAAIASIVNASSFASLATAEPYQKPNSSTARAYRS